MVFVFVFVLLVELHLGWWQSFFQSRLVVFGIFEARRLFASFQDFTFETAVAEETGTLLQFLNFRNIVSCCRPYSNSWLEICLGRHFALLTSYLHKFVMNLLVF